MRDWPGPGDASRFDRDLMLQYSISAMLRHAFATKRYYNHSRN